MSAVKVPPPVAPASSASATPMAKLIVHFMTSIQQVLRTKAGEHPDQPGHPVPGRVVWVAEACGQAVPQGSDKQIQGEQSDAGCEQFLEEATVGARADAPRQP